LPGLSGTQLSPTEIFATSPYTSLATSSTHALGVKPDGTLWGWGANDVGELGEAPVERLQLTPTQVRAP
jgi:alpha-tubulin suppressor-like RCC1 family protein